MLQCSSRWPWRDVGALLSSTTISTALHYSHAHQTRILCSALQCIIVQWDCSRTAVGLTGEFHLGSILCSRGGYNGCSSGREFTLLEILSGRNVSMLPFCQTRWSGADLLKAFSLEEAILMKERKILSFRQCPNQIDLPLLDGGDVYSVWREGCYLTVSS